MSEFFTGFFQSSSEEDFLYQYTDALPKFTSLAEAKMVLYIYAYTGRIGARVKITVDEFMHGLKTPDGTRFDEGTGLSERAFHRGLRRAVQHGFVQVEIDDTDLAGPKYYALRKRAGHE